MGKVSLLAACLVALVLPGCASNDPAPIEQMRLTQKAVEQALAVGATDQIEEMKTAQAKLARAEKNMGEQDYKRARVLAEQAELDARLAEAKVLARKSQDQVAELTARIDRLRKHLGAVQ